MEHKKTGAFFLLIVSCGLNAVLTDTIGEWKEAGIFTNRTFCRRLGEVSYLYPLLTRDHWYNEIHVGSQQCNCHQVVTDRSPEGPDLEP